MTGTPRDVASSCCSDEALWAHLQGRSSHGGSPSVIEHIEDCAGCRGRLVHLVKLDVPVGTERKDVPLTPGSKLGRYVLQRPLGAGAMGIVYEAEDPELGRQVAIKVLRPGGQSLTASAARERLLREARALAKLAHANVVRVYDVGLAGGCVYMALELVEGVNLREAVAEAPPTRKLQLLLEAGKGLAAAHAQGLVHRDFKPENVLVSREGAVRVTDFGLAKAPRSRPTGGHRRLATRSTGALAGTPAYMAPELLKGEAATDLSDQYAFCVAAHECLFGTRPGPGEFPLERGREPRRLRAVLGRGLSPEPDARYDSMEDLLDALRPPPARWPWGLGGLAVLGVLATLVMLRPSDPCLQKSRWDGVWDAPAKMALKRTLEGANPRSADALFALLAARLDLYTTLWSRLEQRACHEARASSRDGSSTAELLCLRQRRQDVAGLLKTLPEPPQMTMERAANLGTLLVPLDGCAALGGVDVKTLLPPSAKDTGTYQRLSELQTGLSTARAMSWSGRAQEALRLAEATTTRAEQQGFRGAQAEGLLLSGRLLADQQDGNSPHVVERLYQAALLGETLRLDALAAEAWLASSASVQAAQPALALERLDLAKGALERSGNSPVLRAEWLTMRGSVLSGMGKMEEGLRLLREGFQLARETYVRGDPRLAPKAVALATALAREDRCTDALPVLGDAETVLSELGGTRSPKLINTLILEGICLTELRRSAESIPVLLRARDISTQALGPGNARLSGIDSNLAEAYLAQGRYLDAEPILQTALELRRRQLGPEHPALAPLFRSLGIAHAALRSHGLGVEELEHAVRLFGQSKDTFQVATTELALADAEERAGQLAAALETARRAALLFEGHPRHAWALAKQGHLLLKAGKSREAAQVLGVAVEKEGAALAQSDAYGVALVELAKSRDALRLVAHPHVLSRRQSQTL